jgi:hypothetical protein
LQKAHGVALCLVGARTSGSGWGELVGGRGGRLGAERRRPDAGRAIRQCPWVGATGGPSLGEDAAAGAESGSREEPLQNGTCFARRLPLEVLHHALQELDEDRLFVVAKARHGPSFARDEGLCGLWKTPARASRQR